MTATLPTPCADGLPTPDGEDAYLASLTPEQREAYEAACKYLLHRPEAQRLDDEAHLCPHFGGRLLLRAELRRTQRMSASLPTERD